LSKGNKKEYRLEERKTVKDTSDLKELKDIIQKLNQQKQKKK